MISNVSILQSSNEKGADGKPSCWTGPIALEYALWGEIFQFSMPAFGVPKCSAHKMMHLLDRGQHRL